jgi:hypothetical protein
MRLSISPVPNTASFSSFKENILVNITQSASSIFSTPVRSKVNKFPGAIFHVAAGNKLHVAAGNKLHANKFPGAIFQSVAKLAGINLWKFGSFSYWLDKPWFHN